MNLFGYGLWCDVHQSFMCGARRYRRQGDIVVVVPRCPNVRCGPFRYKTNPDNSPVYDERGELIPDEPVPPKPSRDAPTNN